MGSISMTPFFGTYPELFCTVIGYSMEEATFWGNEL